jgi:cell wall-associated NlpC family hydrolase
VPFVHRPAAPRLTRAHSRFTALAVVIAALQASVAFGAERPADRSLAEQAGTSLAAAATRVVDGTRELGMFALSLVGIDYRYGGDTPERGLDCSGLIRYVFQEVTGVTLPRTSKELSRIGRDVRAAELAPGDLVFFNTRRFAFSHVGIYLGDDRFIHAPSRGGEVGVASLSSEYWRKRYNGARRLVGVLPALMPSLVARAETSVPPSPTSADAGPLTPDAVPARSGDAFDRDAPLPDPPAP